MKVYNCKPANKGLKDKSSYTQEPIEELAVLAARGLVDIENAVLKFLQQKDKAKDNSLCSTVKICRALNIFSIRTDKKNKGIKIYDDVIVQGALMRLITQGLVECIPLGYFVTDKGREKELP